MTTGLIMAALFGLMAGAASAKAALFGVVVAALPGLWMALWLLPRRRQPNAAEMARAFYWGELGKLGLSAGLFLTAALLFGQQFLALLATYVACQACYWLALVLTR